jgi:hypothetical protein
MEAKQPFDRWILLYVFMVSVIHASNGIVPAIPFDPITLYSPLSIALAMTICWTWLVPS